MEKIYCIKDSQGNYGGHLNIFSNSITGKGDYQWNYYSTSYPFSWYEGDSSRIILEKDISELREINLLAEFNLNWEIIEFENSDAIMDLLVRCRDLSGSDSFVVVKNVKKGCVGRHIKCVKEIKKKYKGMSIDICDSISDEYIAELV